MSVLKLKEGGVWKDIPTIVGEAAGFGEVTATVDTNVGTPTVVVTSSGEDTAKNFAFQFKNLGYDDSDLQSDFSDLANDFDVLQGQFDTAVAAVTTDTEVTDIRVGADGVTDTTAGASVRRQFTDVKSDIDACVRTQDFTWTIGKMIDSSGNYINSVYTATTDYKPCESGDIIDYTGSKKDANNKALNCYVHFYGSNKSWMQRSLANPRVTAPSSAKYYRLSYGRASATGVTFVESDISSYFSLVQYQKMTTEDEFENTLVAIHNGLIEKWILTPTITAYLFRDGHFAVIGIGSAPTYTSLNLPPWGDREYISQIKSIYLDDRITFSAMGSWFDEGASDAYACGECKELVLNGTATSIRGRSFVSLRINHINFAKYADTNVAITDIVFFPNDSIHTVFSLPSAICTPTVIGKITDEIEAMTGAPNVVGLFITDSTDLRDAIFECLNDESLSGVVQHNITCLYCEELGSDGFPTYWTSQMKDVFREIIPYIGYNRNTRGVTEGGEVVYHTHGLTGLSAYRSMGFPSVYDNNAVYRIATAVDGAITQVKTITGQNGLGGHPYDNSLNALTNGLSCSGFVEWLYWRYFSENFSIANVDGFYQQKTWFGGAQPLIEITAEDVKPFDILCYAEYEDDEYVGGHVAIYLGQDTYTNRPLVINQEEGGLVFSTWASVWDAGTKYLRLYKSYPSVSAGKLRQE